MCDASSRHGSAGASSCSPQQLVFVSVGHHPAGPMRRSWGWLGGADPRGRGGSPSACAWVLQQALGGDMSCPTATLQHSGLFAC